MADHFSDFEERYSDHYAKEYGKYRIIRIDQAHHPGALFKNIFIFSNPGFGHFVQEVIAAKMFTRGFDDDHLDGFISGNIPECFDDLLNHLL
jgi:hypothetical protein